MLTWRQTARPSTSVPVMVRTASPSTAFSVPTAPSSTRSSSCVTGGSTWTARWLSSSTPATMRLQQRGRLTQVAARVEQLETREETRGEETREETNEEEARVPGDKLVRVPGPQPRDPGPQQRIRVCGARGSSFWCFFSCIADKHLCNLEMCEES